MPTLECPTCHRNVAYANREEVPFRPFCSSRCKLIDLHHWLNEEYRISEPAIDPDPEGVDDEPPEQ